jgi:hypothetical protein
LLNLAEANAVLLAQPGGSADGRSTPFLPAKNFDTSKTFYETLGFKKLLDADVAIFGIGCTVFILTSYHHEGWAENSMMQLMVDDLDVWWDHITALLL